MNRKILHAADIHLDSPLQKLSAYEGAPAERIRLASRRALENLVRLAIDEKVELVVIAGDLYDGDWTDQNTGLFFVSQATKLVEAGIPIVVIRGNHDAANRMTSSLPLPKNPDGSEILMRSDAVDVRAIEELGIAVHGRSFPSRAVTENLAAEYPSPLGGMCNVGLLHTSLTGAEGHDPYSPCTPAQLADKQYDYWALGHIHVRGDHAIEGAAPVVFSGNVQGRHIREAGAKGCMIVDIDSRNQCSTSFRELDVVRWQLCSIDVSGMQHPDDVVDEYQKWLSGAIEAAEQRLLVTRVELVGQTEAHHSLRRKQSQLRSHLQATASTYGREQIWFEELKVRCTEPIEQRSDVDLDGPMASLATVISQFREDSEAAEEIRRQLLPLSKKLPLELEGVDSALPFEDSQWVGELIESAASEVMGRLQQEDEQ